MVANVLIRHNTALFERAVDLVVKQAAIPTLQAEAAAHDKIARANAFRRMMTGGAIAIAAVGIGYGAALFFGRDHQLPPVVDTTQTEKRDDRIPTTEKLPQDSKTERTEAPAPEVTPKPDTTTPTQAPKPPDVVTADFNKFLTREIDWQGSHWSLVSGHHFNDEHDATWDHAWCYTRRLVNGVDVNVDLVNRASPTARPQAPVSPSMTLASIGVNDASALELASECVWLDKSSFSANDYEAPAGRAEAANKLVAQDGWDAMGSDLPSMPLWNVSFDQCQTQCEGDNRCAAITYDKKHSACFMKGDASVLVKDPDATMAAKQVVGGKLQYSSLVFYKNTVVVGESYSNVPSAYADCVMACAMDQKCLGFNFDSPNKMCSMLDRVDSLALFKGVASGSKTAGN
ncbi:hypothetical protein FJ950_24530 [Mesorhizobium sp. B2-3-14]|uniref:PAN domain-containing protein n=1 Tax=Mesorhizobium sp. B2-3-14 TaxID=2589950 RepID=UPI00112C5583|nr:PAN domain-containing protein [Mesorhizobium sp. B2-3-14]TPL81388.1 hypothetical protein FJ950_24530 [Mesorhizobium sp. B2-3-14]